MATARLPVDDELFWRMCKALGNPVRMQIVRFVRHHPRCIANEILLHLPDECPHAQSTLSQHMRVLREAGLIEAEPDGPAVCYQLSPKALSWLREQLSDLG
jgi:ArsR family transcriptional regulator, arsenate/arsenite/antimonite-responsive transcriptional repressor